VSWLRGLARKLRLAYAGAIYHVMNRGDRQEPICEDDRDRERCLETLAQACLKTGWQVPADCLMRHHFHLVLETPQADLVAGMHGFLSTYTARFNRRHRRCGHLFRGRYKSLIVDRGWERHRLLANGVRVGALESGARQTPEARAGLTGVSLE
jgi:REP element-mobilizing transposase RayT